MYIHKNSLGLGLIRPNRILSIMALKLYFGYTQLDGSTNKLITNNLEMMQVKVEQNTDYTTIPKEEKR